MVKVKFIAKSQWHLEAELIDVDPELPRAPKDYFEGCDLTIRMEKRMEINSKIRKKVEAKIKR